LIKAIKHKDILPCIAKLKTSITISLRVSKKAICCKISNSLLIVGIDNFKK